MRHSAPRSIGDWPASRLSLVFPLAFWLAALGASADSVTNGPIHLASPDGRLVLTFAVRDFDGAVNCPVYSLARGERVLVSDSKLGLSFGAGLLRENLVLVSQTNRTHDSIWQPVCGERSSIRDHYSQLVVHLRETAAPNRLLQLTFRAYNAGVAFCYTVPAQPGLAGVTNLTEQSEFRFGANHPAWAVYSAQGNYSAVTLGEIRSGCERPLTIQIATNLYLAAGEARLVDYARMKFAPLSGVPNSLVSALSGPVASALPLTTPWRFILVAESAGQLLENNDLMLNLNEPCAIADTSWIKPGKVIREVTLTTAGALACVDFAAKHHVQYVEFDAGWYGPEYSSTNATRVNVDPSRSKGSLDLQAVVNHANSNGVGVILYVNQVALSRQIDILPALYRSWGVRGMKFGFVNVGSQRATAWLHHAVRQCATNQIMVDVHDELRPSGYSRTYPNLMTVEGIRGDEETPPASQDMVTLFSRMLAGPGDHTVCYFDSRVTNKWNHAYQLAKAVCFFSPWQFLYWYDRPSTIAEVPELEFYDHLRTVWDETRVLEAGIGQHVIVARRHGGDWFLGAMNAGTNRTFQVALNFLPPGQRYDLHNYIHDLAVPTRTHVRIDRSVVDWTSTLSIVLGPSEGQAARLTPVDGSSMGRPENHNR